MSCKTESNRNFLVYLVVFGKRVTIRKVKLVENCSNYHSTSLFEFTFTTIIIGRSNLFSTVLKLFYQSFPHSRVY